jgi:hypothetical protein
MYHQYKMSNIKDQAISPGIPGSASRQNHPPSCATGRKQNTIRRTTTERVTPSAYCEGGQRISTWKEAKKYFASKIMIISS